MKLFRDHFIGREVMRVTLIAIVVTCLRVASNLPHGRICLNDILNAFIKLKTSLSAMISSNEDFMMREKRERLFD